MSESELPSTVPSPESQRYIDTLLSGGFVCLLPHSIDPAWSEPSIPIRRISLERFISWVGTRERSAACAPARSRLLLVRSGQFF
jgi:hypothetical protein